MAPPSRALPREKISRSGMANEGSVRRKITLAEYHRLLRAGRIRPRYYSGVEVERRMLAADRTRGSLIAAGEGRGASSFVEHERVAESGDEDERDFDSLFEEDTEMGGMDMVSDEHGASTVDGEARVFLPVEEDDTARDAMDVDHEEAELERTAPTENENTAPELPSVTTVTQAAVSGVQTTARKPQLPAPGLQSTVRAYQPAAPGTQSSMAGTQSAAPEYRSPIIPEAVAAKNPTTNWAVQRPTQTPTERGDMDRAPARRVEGEYPDGSPYIQRAPFPGKYINTNKNKSSREGNGESRGTAREFEIDNFNAAPSATLAQPRHSSMQTSTSLAPPFAPPAPQCALSQPIAEQQGFDPFKSVTNLPQQSPPPSWTSSNYPYVHHQHALSHRTSQVGGSLLPTTSPVLLQSNPLPTTMSGVPQSSAPIDDRSIFAQQPLRQPPASSSPMMFIHAHPQQIQAGGFMPSTALSGGIRFDAPLTTLSQIPRSPAPAPSGMFAQQPLHQPSTPPGSTKLTYAHYQQARASGFMPSTALPGGIGAGVPRTPTLQFPQPAALAPNGVFAQQPLHPLLAQPGTIKDTRAYTQQAQQQLQLQGPRPTLHQAPPHLPGPRTPLPLYVVTQAPPSQPVYWRPQNPGPIPQHDNQRSLIALDIAFALQDTINALDHQQHPSSFANFYPRETYSMQERHSIASALVNRAITMHTIGSTSLFFKTLENRPRSVDATLTFEGRIKHFMVLVQAFKNAANDVMCGRFHDEYLAAPIASYNALRERLKEWSEERFVQRQRVIDGQGEEADVWEGVVTYS